MYSVQMISDNTDIKNNPRVRELYPQLYAEVERHDLDSFSSWYDLSDQAYAEYLKYLKNQDIGYFG